MYYEEMVRDSYNQMGARYNQIRNRTKNNQELAFFTSLLPKHGYVLDAGCGAGEPVAKYLVADGIRVTGIDVSQRMINLAKQQVPQGEFLEGDITNLTFPDASFDGVVCLYTIWHIPKQKHGLVFQKFSRVLKPGGILFFNTGIRDMDGVDMFLGAPMVWSSPPPEETLALVKNAGFTVLRDEILIRGGETQYWVFAQKK
jgi:ubiquinone/menaquinone biosynthesis C-methylase UbiE